MKSISSFTSRVALLSLLVISSSSFYCFAKLYPIQFSISEMKIVHDIPEKDRDFASLIPGDMRTYIYDEESVYYRDYQRSYFAITFKKGGWDCMRHYEILANGCIPYFVDIDRCNPNTMYLLPKDLIKEAMNLPGVSYGHIDHSKFDKKRYYEILNKLLEYTRNHLTTRAMADYLLRSIKYTGTGKVLYLSNQLIPDYMRESNLIGLRELLGERLIDYPKIDFLYKNYSENVRRLYGKGFSYSKVLDDIPLNRNNIEQRIKNKEFDLIIYGSAHRGLLFHDLVCATYEPDKIIYICGEDAHHCEYAGSAQLFLREFDSI